MAFVLSRPARLLLVVLLGIFSLAHFSHAALPCGDIVAPEYFFGTSHLSSLINVSIDNCADPFAVTSQTAPYVLKINDIEISNGQTAYLAPEQTPNIQVLGQPTLTDYQIFLFRHDADNYQFVELYPETDEGLILDIDTYTIVIQEYDISVSQYSPLQRFINFFIPVAYAQIVPIIYTITFNVAEPPLEPTGASSILFLPGIQASRLYKDGILGTEDQLWEPNINNDLEALAMDEDGFSVNQVYTKDVLGEIFGVGNVYKGFLDDLADLKENEQIKDFLPFAYDWRYGVDDIVVSGTQYENEIKSVIAEIERLADDSYTNKVTIIGHSNGGLLAKAIMIELGRLEKTDLIDKLVLVGSPQVGTPKAIGAMLHGLDQQAGGGIITDDQTAREVMKNMAGAYGLLPSKKYFELVSDVLVSQDDSAATAYLDSFADVTSYDSLNNFLRGNHLGGSINIPSALNEDMLDQAYSLHESIDEWQAPENVDVFEIAGVGIPTIKGFEYREFGCSSHLGGLSCLHGKYSKPYPLFTTYGDETVIATSALAYGGAKVKAVVDLFQEGEQFLASTKKHANITESPTIKEYLDSIIKFGYQNETLEIPENFVRVVTHIIIGVHSPVNITLTDTEGKKVGIFEGQLFEEIAGSQYFELGGSKYLIIPEENDYVVSLEGVSEGLYSITIDSLNEDDTQQNLLSYLGAISGPVMKATFSFNGTNFSNIETDIDGDGELDIKYNWDGTSVIIEPEVIGNKNSNSSGTRINKILAGVIPTELAVSVIDESELNELQKQLYLLLQELSILLSKWRQSQK